MSVKKLHNGRWEVSIYLPGHTAKCQRRWRRRYHDKATAEEVDARIRAAIPTGRLRDTIDELEGAVGKVQMFADLTEQYISDYAIIHLAPRSITSMRSRLALWKEFFRTMAVADIRLSDVDAYVTTRKRKGIANSTINSEIARLHHLFEWSLKRRLIRINPIAGYDKLKVDRQGFREDTEEAIDSVISQIDDRFRPVFIFIRETGCRRFNAFNLKWDQVNLKDRVAILTETKSGKPAYLLLTEAAVQAIRSMPRVVGCSYVFPAPSHGGYWSTHGESVWRTAREKAGYPWLKVKDMRKAFAVKWANTPGIEKHLIQSALGHSSLRVTEDFYAVHKDRLAVQHLLEIIEPMRQAVNS